MLSPSKEKQSLTPQSTALTRVLHLINGEHFSGAERVQDLLGMALPDFGFEVGFGCLKPEKFPKVRQAVDCEIHDLKMRNKFDMFRAGDIVQLCRDRNYRLIHAHTPRSLLVGRLAARKLKCPLVYHVHSPVGRDSARSLHNTINTWIEKWSLKGVDQMICVSGSLKEYMESLGHAADKLSVVRNGVARVDDIDRAPPAGNKLTLGTIALFRPRKGTEVLLDAIALLKQEGVSVRLRAVGPFETAEYEQEILNRVQDLGIESQIEWLGFQKNVDLQLRQMDLMVLPSLYGEGLPMVVLEAMANGVPVIASRVEGIPEAIRDGKDGLIFEPGSPEDLAAKIRSLLGQSELWLQMSQNAKERQRESLSDLSMARGVAEVYQRVIQDPI